MKFEQIRSTIHV